MMQYEHLEHSNHPASQHVNLFHQIPTVAQAERLLCLDYTKSFITDEDYYISSSRVQLW